MKYKKAHRMNRPPNRLPSGLRIAFGVLAVAMVGYGINGLVKGKLDVPSKRNGTLEGMPMVLMVLALMCGTAVLVSLIVGHYDKPDKVQSYHRFARNGFIVGLVLVFLGFGVKVVRLLAE